MATAAEIHGKSAAGDVTKEEAVEGLSPALEELLGLRDESSYGKLLRTMPRGLKDELASASSWGRQSLLPLLLSVSDTTNRKTTLLWLWVVYFKIKARLEFPWCSENEIKESSLEGKKDLSRGRGRIPDGCHVAKFLKMRDGIRQNTDGSCSRSPSCRLCPGRTPGLRALLSEPPLWKVSCNPGLTDLLQEPQTGLDEEQSHSWSLILNLNTERCSERM